MNKFITLTALAATVALAGCGNPNSYRSSDQMQYAEQERMLKQAVQEIGMPAIKNFQEKRLMKDILELRDNPKLVTYAYTEDMNGRLHLRCHSIGYGLPYATQYTNPGNADPNGLYSPGSADGTWILCKVPGTDKVEPQYFEPKLIVTTYPLENN